MLLVMVEGEKRIGMERLGDVLVSQFEVCHLSTVKI